MTSGFSFFSGQRIWIIILEILLGKNGHFLWITFATGSEFTESQWNWISMQMLPVDKQSELISIYPTFNQWIKYALVIFSKDKNS